MNSAGRIVGNTRTGVSGRANGLNDLGHVAGGYATWGSDHAYLGDELINLDRQVEGADGWRMVEAYGIKDAQQILVRACRGDECVPVRPDLVAAVPEPGSYAMLAAGLVLLVGWRKSGRQESLSFSQPGSLER